MVSRPREEPTSSSAPEVRDGPVGGAPPRGIVFMTDPSAEAERAAQALRASAYLVLDVPLALLPSRVAVQRPDVIVVDAEAEGVRDAVARLRALPGGQGIDLLFLGALGAEADDLVLEASGVFRRPLDVSHIVRKIQALLPLDSSPYDEHLTPPPSLSASLSRAERAPTTPPPPPVLPWPSAPSGLSERSAALAPPRRQGSSTSRPPGPNVCASPRARPRRAPRLRRPGLRRTRRSPIRARRSAPASPTNCAVCSKTPARASTRRASKSCPRPKTRSTRSCRPSCSRRSTSRSRSTKPSARPAPTPTWAPTLARPPRRPRRASPGPLAARVVRRAAAFVDRFVARACVVRLAAAAAPGADLHGRAARRHAPRRRWGRLAPPCGHAPAAAPAPFRERARLELVAGGARGRSDPQRR